MNAATAYYTISFTWDFSTDGNAIGTYQTGISIPANAAINRCVFAALTPLVSPGATMNIFCAGVTLLTAFINVAAGLMGGSTDPYIILAGNSIQNVTLDISATVATSGIMKGWIQYFPQ